MQTEVVRTNGAGRESQGSMLLALPTHCDLEEDTQYELRQSIHLV